MKEGIKIEGTLLEFEEKTLGGKQAFSAKIDNHFLTWWELPAAKEFAAKNPLNTKVVCIYTEKPNPRKPQYPYKNINALNFPENFEVKTFEEIKEETVAPPPAEGKELWNPQFYGMCSNQAMRKLQHEVDFNEEKYKALIRKLFKINKELIKELREG